MCYTRRAHAGLSSILCFTGCIWALNWHLTETGWRNRSRLLTPILSGSLNEAQGALCSLGEHSHEGVNPSVHLGHPTEGENEDNRGINEPITAPKFHAPISEAGQLVSDPRGAFPSWRNCTTRQNRSLPTVLSAIPCPSDPVGMVQKYLLINHTEQADNPPEGSTWVEST